MTLWAHCIRFSTYIPGCVVCGNDQFCRLRLWNQVVIIFYLAGTHLPVERSVIRSFSLLLFSSSMNFHKLILVPGRFPCVEHPSRPDADDWFHPCLIILSRSFKVQRRIILTTLSPLPIPLLTLPNRTPVLPHHTYKESLPSVLFRERFPRFLRLPRGASRPRAR